MARSLGIDPATMIDLSASLNPFAPDVTRLAGRHLDALVPYPDDGRATRALAAAIGVDPALLVLTNGGAEAIALVAGVVGTGEVVEPEFSLYRRHLESVVDGTGRWRSDPSNPCGTLASASDTAAVWDEAFYPLATGSWTRGDVGAWRLGSLTKLWACAGLRLGFVIAPDAAGAGAVRARRPRWSVNGLALALVDDLLERTDLGAWASSIRAVRGEFSHALRTIGYDVTETEANWVLVHDVVDLRSRVAPLGVAVRDCTSFGMPRTARVALPRDADIERVVSAFDRCRRIG
ncbi:aminotransferase class I/II-fold pyridoxal phosphate-dependent enzyme [Ilumatobacter sp.]|uniref:aminotransferase class I/II-fold pyridoxal phosphate-dependent enzyme n=1 Tax=Ilumatobacter sp. TaxID=1967498 RepID=UPI003B525446